MDKAETATCELEEPAQAEPEPSPQEYTDAAVHIAKVIAEADSADGAARPSSILRRDRAEPRRPQWGEGVTWDEESLAEQALERGTRMPIDEPKTPWHDPVASDEEIDRAIDDLMAPQEASSTAAQLSRHVEAEEAAARASAVASPGSTREADAVSVVSWAAATEGGRESSEEFKAKRRMHYDEFKMMQAFRAKQARGEASDEE